MINETHAEIVADMRYRAKRPDYVAPCVLEKYADRSEAAHKREMSKIVSKNGAGFGQLGDAAAMREALENCAKMGEQIDCQLGSSDETVYAFRNERCLAHNISECARSALAAPPRNCERFKTKEEAAIAFANEKKQWIPQQVLWELAPWLDWLFATAKEGEADGSK